MRTVRNQFRILACQVLVVKHFALFAGDQSRLALDTSDETVAITRHGEAGERPELGGLRVGRHFSRAFEADDRCGRNQDLDGSIVMNKRVNYDDARLFLL